VNGFGPLERPADIIVRRANRTRHIEAWPQVHPAQPLRLSSGRCVLRHHLRLWARDTLWLCRPRPNATVQRGGNRSRLLVWDSPSLPKRCSRPIHRHAGSRTWNHCDPVRSVEDSSSARRFNASPIRRCAPRFARNNCWRFQIVRHQARLEGRGDSMGLAARLLRIGHP